MWIPDTPHKLRIAVLGDSYVAGYLVSCPWRAGVSRAVKMLFGPDVDIRNFGASGVGWLTSYSNVGRHDRRRDFVAPLVGLRLLDVATKS
jgi:hypothetical protein